MKVHKYMYHLSICRYTIEMYTRTLQLDLVNKKHPTSEEAEETCKNTQKYLTKMMNGINIDTSRKNKDNLLGKSSCSLCFSNMTSEKGNKNDTWKPRGMIVLEYPSHREGGILHSFAKTKKKSKDTESINLYQ